MCIHHCPLCRIGASVFHQYLLPVYLNGGRAGFLYSLSILCKFTCFFAKKHGIWHKFSPQKIFFVKKSEFFIRFFQIWFAKKKGTDFFVSRSLSWVSPLCCAFMLCIVCGGRALQTRGRTPLCNRRQTECHQVLLEWPRCEGGRRSQEGGRAGLPNV